MSHIVLNSKKIFTLLSLMTIFIIGASIHIISKPAKAAPTTYYFNNAVNTNPATLGNYWYDEDATDPALELPDLNEDEVTILSSATYAGNAVFNGSAVNNGTVNGNAVFVNDSSENFGTVTGTKTRRYIGNAYVERDFVSDGPWTILADGGEVTIDAAVTDQNTLFARANGGYFVSFYFTPVDGRADNTTITVFYSTLLDQNSVPVAGDFTVNVNGSPVAVTDVSVVTSKVILTINTPILETDTVTVDYSLGSEFLLNDQGLNADAFTNFNIIVLKPMGLAPVYSALVGKKLYISNNHSSSITVVDTTTNTVLDPIPVEAYPEFIVLVGKKLYVNNLQSDSVSIIDTATDTVVKTVQVGNGPYFSTVVGRKIYISNTNTDTISVLDTTTDTVTATITVGTAPWLAGAVGTKLYVPNRISNSVSVINTVTDTVSATIPITSINGQGTNALVVGNNVYVAKNNSTVAVINSLTDTVIATPSTGLGSYFACAVGTKAYFPNRGTNTVSVVNALTNTFIKNITVGSQPTTCVVIGSKVYVTKDGNSNTISVIDTTTDTLVDTVTVGFKPFYATPVGNTLYTSNNFSNNFTALDTTTVLSQLPNLTSFSTTAANGIYTTGQVIPITANFGQALLAGSTMTVTLNTGASVVLNNVSGTTLSGNYTIIGGQTTPDLAITAVTTASVSDLSSHTRTSYSLPSSQGNLVAENSFITRNLGDSKNIVIGSYLNVPVGTNPYQISAPITVNGLDYLYVANQGEHSVSVLRQPDNSVITTIPVGSEPYGLATVTVSGITYIYVANTGSDTVSVINTGSNTLTATIDVGVRPYYVAAVGSKVYVTNSLSNTVSVINALTNSVIATIAVGSYPRGIKAQGTDLYVANYGDPNYSGGNSISVINSLTNTVTATIISPIGSDGPRGVNVLGTKVYVTNFRSNNVSVIDTATKAITNTITVGRGPRGVLGLGSKVYIENFDDGTISVIDTGTNTVTATLYVGNTPSGISADGTDLYLTRFQDNSVSILNTLTNILRPAAPLLSGLSVTIQTPNTVEVQWTTDKTSDSLIEYGLTTAYGSSVSSPTLTTSHTLNVSGLIAGRTYHYRVTSFDSDGNAVISADATFSTPGGGGGGSVGAPVKNVDVVLPPASQEPTPGQDSNDDTENSPAPVKQPTFFCPGWSSSVNSDAISTSLVNRLKGWFLLAVEDRGSLWYVSGANNARYEVKLPTALCFFQFVSQGISNADINKIPVAGNASTSTPLGERLKGSVLIQPEAHGQTSYVDFRGFRHALSASNLLATAANFALGITNANLEKITIGSGQ